MRQRILRAALGLILTAGLATGFPTAAANAVPQNCDVPEPPPICYEDPDPVPHEPQGALRSAARVPSGIQVTGWATDADGAPTIVDLRIGSTPVGSLTADQPDPEMGNVGFSGIVPAVAGTAVCATARNIGRGADTSLGCLDVTIVFNPFGNLDGATLEGEKVTVHGWAIDPDTAGEVMVEIFHDGQLGARIPANADRPDVGAVYPAYGSVHGYIASLPAKPDGDHTVCAYALHVQGTGGTEQDTQLGCKTYTVRHNPYGTLDEVTRIGSDVRVRGTATDPDDPVAPIGIHIYVDGGFIGNIQTSGGRYDTTFAATRAPGTHTVCAYAINLGPGTDNPQLGCRTFTIPQPVTAPTLTIGTVGANTVEMKWATSDVVMTGFRVEYSSCCGIFTTSATVAADVRSHVVTGLSPQTPYCFRVVALGEFTEASADTCLWTKAPALAPATQLNFPYVGDAKVTVRWWDAVDAESTYLIDVRDKATGGLRTLTAAGAAGTGWRTYTVTGLTADTEYAVGVRPSHPDHAETPIGPDATVRTDPLPQVTELAVTPPDQQACAPQNQQLSFTATGALWVEIWRVVPTRAKLHSAYNPESDAVSGTLDLGADDTAVTYEAVLYSEDGTRASKMINVRVVSDKPLVNKFYYMNNSLTTTVDLYYYTPEGIRGEKIATLAPKQTIDEQKPPQCSIFKLVAVRTDQPSVIDFESKVLMGHRDGASHGFIVS